MNNNIKKILTNGTYSLIAIGGIIVSTVTGLPAFGVIGTIAGTSGILVHSTIWVEDKIKEKQEYKKIIIEEFKPNKETSKQCISINEMQQESKPVEKSLEK